MIDLEAPLQNGTTQRVMMSLLDAAAEMADAEASRCLNALSIPLDSTAPGIPDLHRIHQSVHVLVLPCSMRTADSVFEYY